MRAGWSPCTGCWPSAGWSSRSTSPTACTSTGSAGWSPGCGVRGGRPGCCSSRGRRSGVAARICPVPAGWPGGGAGSGGGWPSAGSSGTCRGASTRCGPPACGTCRARRWPGWPPSRAGSIRVRVSSSSSPAAAQPEVFAVVDGALEARAPGDPAGTVRERVGAGGVVGLGPAMPGRPSPLAWYTAGTTPAGHPVHGGGRRRRRWLASVIARGTAREAEQLFAESPALAGLSYEDRLGLASVAVPVSLPPGATVELSGPPDAVVVASGVDRHARRPRARPRHDDRPGRREDLRARWRSPGRRCACSACRRWAGWRCCSARGGALAGGVGRAGARRTAGLRRAPAAAYPPLAAPPGPPPPGIADETDGRFERKLRWLLILVLLLALLFTGGNIAAAAVGLGRDADRSRRWCGWSAAPRPCVGGVELTLGAGDEIYVGQATR